ncbi:sugar porter family MFS transporter [Stygiolobus caldivivus]|uniref:MFS transporter n=1 Tax=Stygiolobus caldivivus TaxID=2824673 RepID=A0A8D5U4Z5_9CREN|nr:sugar porter family MFS transporter [Stygiolobus caldivivus]BCU69142.1 MFS transporter [Stygiolobus caldivivus]
MAGGNYNSIEEVLRVLDSKKVNRFYWIITILAAIGGFLFGYDTAVIGTVAPLTPYHYSGLLYGYEVASASLGAAIGALIAYFYTDRYGRKSLLIIDAGIYTGAAILSALTINGLMLLIMRTIIGIAIGADSAVATAYITEYAPKDKRGTLAIMQQWMITIGILGSYLIGSFVLFISPSLAYTIDWRLLLGLAAIPAVVGLLFRFLMPESPRWMIYNGKFERLKKDLMKFGMEISDSDLKNIRNELINEKKETYRLSKATKKALLIVGLWLVFQQITGINVPFYYGPTVLSKLHIFGTTSNPVYSIIESVLESTVLAAINVAATYIAFRYIDRIGRRTLGISAYIGMLISDLIGGISVLTNFLFGVLIAFAGFIIFFAYGVGGTGWLIQAEYFDTRVRGRMAAIGAIIDWLANFALIEVFPVMLSTIGLSGSMFVFSALDVIALAFVILFLPETKGMSLEEVVRMFETVPLGKLRHGKEIIAKENKEVKAK